jgi:hypothetical protein
MFAANVLDPNGLGNPYHPWSTLCGLAALIAVCAAVCIALNGVGTALEQRHSRRQLPPGPAAQGLDGDQRGGAGHGPVPPGSRDGQASRVDLRGHRSRPRRRQLAGQVGRATQSGRPAPRAT